MEAAGQLAGGIAHDFNNLLTVINGYSELMLLSLPVESPHCATFEQIRQDGEKASRLSRQLLGFSRQQVLQPKVLDLNAVVANIDTMLQRVIGEVFFSSRRRHTRCSRDWSSDVCSSD